MRFSKWAVVPLGAIMLAPAFAAPLILYDGAAAPAAPWGQNIIGSPVVTPLGDGTTAFQTITPVGARSGEANLYSYTTDTANFIASIRLKVLAVNAHNQLDAGLMFSAYPYFSLPAGNSGSRSSMLYIDAARIGWADDTQSTPVDTSQFHEYTIRYVNGALDVFIDTAYADIQSGTATPVLSRTVATSNTSSADIVFGDQSNDPNVDSHYVVDYVQLLDLSPPSPPAIAGADVGDGAVRVNVTPPGDSSASTITHYTVSAVAPGDQPAGSCTAPASAAPASCTVSGLTNGVAYTFNATATNGQGDSASASTTATPQLLATAAAVSLPGGAGTAHATIGGNPPGCTLGTAPFATAADLQGAPDKATAPLGAIGFTALGCPGATLAVQIDYPAGALQGRTAYKWGPASVGAQPSWFAYGDVTGDRVRFSVTDNGVGDNNTLDTGTIQDPFAPLELFKAPPVAATPVPVLGYGALAGLSALLAACGLVRRRRQQAA